MSTPAGAAAPAVLQRGYSAAVTNAFYTSQHITETYLSLLSAVGVPIVTREVSLTPRPADQTAIAPLVGIPNSKIGNPKSKIFP